MIDPMLRSARFHHRTPAAWAPLLWLLAMAFTLRALLPAGYMADAQAWRHGSLTIALCLADGSIRTSKPQPHGADIDPAYAPCPAGAVKLLALPDLPVPVLVAPTVWVLHLAAAPGRADALVLAAGPPLGSRAPPAHRIVLSA